MKLCIIVCAIIFFGITGLQGQSNTWEWAQSAGATKFDAGNAICDDAQGNIYSAGTFSDSVTFGNVTLTGAGNQDAMVVKCDPSGGVIWAKRFGGIWSDLALGISTDNENNVYVTGVSGSPDLVFANDTLDSCGFFIAKYDSLGNEEWIRSSTGINETSIGNAIDADILGNTYVTGKFTSSTLSFGTTILTNSGSDDMFIARYDAFGNFLWARKAGYSASEYGSGVSIDNSGNACVTGTFWGDSIAFGSAKLYNNGSVNVFTVKYDVLGTVTWAKSANNLSSLDGIWAGAIVADATGNIYVTGSYSGGGMSFGNYTLSSSGPGDVFITKYGPTGNVFWARTAGGNSIDYAYGISFDSNGNSFVTGTFESSFLVFGPSTIYNSGTRNVFVMKFGPTGLPQWAINGEGNYSDRGFAILTTLNNETYITGEFRSLGITFGTIDLSNASPDSVGDYFIAKIGTSVALPADPDMQGDILAYPNPFTDELTIEINDIEFRVTEILLQDITGRQVYNVTHSFNANSSVINLNLKKLPPGMYFLNMFVEGQLLVKKIIKE